MASQNRKQRRKHLQPGADAAKKEDNLFPELELAKPTENAVQPESDKSEEKAGFLASYQAFKAKKEQEKKTGGRRIGRKRFAVLGAFAVVFAVIGIIASVQFCVKLGVSVANQDKLKQELMPYLAPYVVTDVPEFTDNAGLSDTVKQRLAVWRLLLTADLSVYPADDYGNIFVPAADVDWYAKELFGKNAHLQPKSDYTGSLAITYDAENSSYLLPMQPDYATYYPDIARIEKETNGYILQVRYMASDLLANLKPDSEPTVIKTMQYHLLKSEDGYQVISVQLISIEADGYYQPDMTEPGSSSEETGEEPVESEPEKLPEESAPEQSEPVSEDNVA